MANRNSKDWKLIANISVVALLATYYLYSRDMNAALAVVVGLLVYSVSWFFNSLRDSRRDRDSEKEDVTTRNSEDDT